MSLWSHLDFWSTDLTSQLQQTLILTICNPSAALLEFLSLLVYLSWTADIFGMIGRIFPLPSSSLTV